MDWIHDLNLDGDKLAFQGYDPVGANVHETSTTFTADNLGDVISDAETFGDFSTTHSTAFLIHYTAGALAGMDFLAINYGGLSLDYLVNVTGVTGTLDATDITGFTP